MNWNPCQGLGLRTIGMVASALADDYNIKVLVTGKTACTSRTDDGETVVTIPALDYDNPDYLTLVRGYVDHEAGHVRFTDFTDARRLGSLVGRVKFERVQGLANIYEDILVERKMGEYYAGCKSNFRRLALHIFGDSKEYESYAQNDGFGLVAGYILYNVRSQVYPELEAGRDFIRNQVEQTYPGLADALDDAILSDVLDQIVSTEDNITLAIDTEKVISRYLTEQMQSIMDGEGQETGQEQGDSDEQQGGGGNTQQSGPSKSALQSLGNHTTDAGVASSVSISERVAKRVGNTALMSEQYLPDSGGVTQVMTFADANGNVASSSGHEHSSLHTSWLPDNDYNNAIRVSCALDAQLQALLQTFVQNRGGAARIGKLDTRKLSRLSVNNPNVFKRVVDKQGVSTDVILLMDVSGSMDCGGRINTATSALYAVMRSLRKIKGVRSSAYAFGSNDILEVVSPDQRLTRKVYVHPDGGTYCGEALMAVVSKFSPKHYDRRMVILLTDGETYNPNYFSYALHRVQRAGVIMLGVGIQHDKLAKYIDDPDRYAEVRYLPDLVPEMFRLLRKNLVGKSL